MWHGCIAMNQLALAQPPQPFSLGRRSSQAEVMDGPEVSAADYGACLRDLAQVNRVTLTHRPVLRWLERQLGGARLDGPIVILDVAFGQGDLLRAIAAWAQARGLKVKLKGIDLNPRSAQLARAATPEGMDIDFHTGDVFTTVQTARPDFIVCSQFTHHLEDAEVVRFLQWADETATRGWFITDLERHAVAYFGFPILCALAGWHDIVRRDGKVSIARSFRLAEWAELARRAGLEAQVEARFPFRVAVSRLK